MRHGLLDVAGRPHQLAGAVLDALAAAIVDPCPFLLDRDQDGADERVRDAVAAGFRLSAIGPTTGRGRSPEDVRAILDLMVPEDIPETAVMAELDADLFGGPGNETHSIGVMLRRADGRPGALGCGAYYNVFRIDEVALRFRRLCGLATDLTRQRGGAAAGCCVVFGLVVVGRDRDGETGFADRLDMQLRHINPRLKARISVLHTGELATPSAAGMRDWASGSPVTSFRAAALAFDAGDSRLERLA